MPRNEGSAETEGIDDPVGDEEILQRGVRCSWVDERGFPTPAAFPVADLKDPARGGFLSAEHPSRMARTLANTWHSGPAMSMRRLDMSALSGTRMDDRYSRYTRPPRKTTSGMPWCASRTLPTHQRQRG